MSETLDRIHRHKALYKRYPPFLDVTLHGLVDCYRLCGTAYRSHLQVQVVKQAQTKLRGIAWERRSQIHRGPRLQSCPFA